MGEYRAVNVTADQLGFEGSFFIAELLSEATQPEADFEYGGEEVKAGFLIVKARWLEYRRTGSHGTRFYTALSENLPQHQHPRTHRTSRDDDDGAQHPEVAPW